jgi:hypothetical protein
LQDDIPTKQDETSGTGRTVPSRLASIIVPTP